MATNPFDYVKSIQKTKIDLIRTADDKDQAIKDYNPFLTNKALSFYLDSVLYANEMNMLSHLDKDQQYAYLINTIRSMNRPHTWFKNEKSDNIDMIMKYYSVNRQRAKETLRFLSEQELKTIISQLNGGGEVTKKK